MSDTSSSALVSFLGPIFGDVYHGKSFTDLQLPPQSTEVFRSAASFINQKRYDHALIEVWKHFEDVMTTLYGFPCKDSAQLINKLKEGNTIDEADMHLLHGMRGYRNKAAHGIKKMTNQDIHVSKGIFVVAIPLLWKLLQKRRR